VNCFSDTTPQKKKKENQEKKSQAPPPPMPRRKKRPPLPPGGGTVGFPLGTVLPGKRRPPLSERILSSSPLTFFLSPRSPKGKRKTLPSFLYPFLKFSDKGKKKGGGIRKPATLPFINSNFPTKKETKEKLSLHFQYVKKGKLEGRNGTSLGERED